MPRLWPSFGPREPALVIRSHAVEVLTLRGRSVTSRVRVPLDGKDDEHLLQAIRKALQEAGLGRVKRVNVSIPTHDVLFRFFTIPVIPKAEWDAVVQFEARKYVPFKMEDLVWDYQVTSSPTAQKLEVIFTAVPQDVFTRVAKVLDAAGLRPMLIEPRSLSLARLMPAPASEADKEFAWLVDVEGEMAHVAIVRGGLPYLTRDVQLGTDQPAQRLLSELSVSRDFFIREYPTSRIGQLFLFGEETVLGPWCRELSEPLGCSVELGNRVLDARVEGGVPLTAASAVGLAQARDPSAVLLDFLRGSQRNGVQVVQPVGMPSAAELMTVLKAPQTVFLAAMPAAALIGLMWFAGAQHLSAERRRLDDVVRLATPMPPQLGGLGQAELESLHAQATTLLALLQHVVDERASVAEQLDALARTLPDGVWFTNIVLTQERVGEGEEGRVRLAVQGACFLDQPDEELTAIQQFLDRVKHHAKALRRFTSVRLGDISAREHVVDQRAYTYRTFELTCEGERRS